MQTDWLPLSTQLLFVFYTTTINNQKDWQVRYDCLKKGYKSTYAILQT